MRRTEATRADRARTLEALTVEGIELHMDVLEIADHEWAIHGLLAYEGEVIAATFTSEDDAWNALSDPAAFGRGVVRR
jgi:hypothetical protein